MDCPKTIIALVGPLGAGKDTVAKQLVERHGFRRFAFADEIKRQYYAATGHSEEEFKAARGTPLEEEIRSGLWQYSDTMRREKGALHFVNSLVSAVRNCRDSVVVTDIRTRDELDQLRGTGARIVLVLRFAKDEEIRVPADEDKIPGARLTYGDLRPYDSLFVNRECDDPTKAAVAVEAWFVLGKVAREGEERI